MIQNITRERIQTIIENKENYRLIEVLPAKYYIKAHLPGAINLPLESVDESAQEILGSKDTPLILYCANLSCPNSTIAAKKLAALGYTQIFKYAEGKEDWMKAGLPTETYKKAAQSTSLAI